MATIDDFQKLDIRVGRIIEVYDFPEAKKPAYKLKIDFGTEIGVKNSSVQIVAFLIPVSFAMHDFWKIEDREHKMMQQTNFMKNAALAGAALMMLSIPVPWIFSIIK